MTRKPLHPTTLLVYHFVKTYMYENEGLSPAIREIMDGCGLVSTSVVAHHLDVPESRRFITRKEGRARSIRLKREPPAEGVVKVRA